MPGSLAARSRRALVYACLLLGAACLAAPAVALQVKAPALVMARSGVGIEIAATTDDSTHVTVTDASTGEILQQRWYVLPQAGPPLALEKVRPRRNGRVALEVQVAGQAPERVNVQLVPDWMLLIVLLVVLGLVRALRRSRRAGQPLRPARSRS